MCAHFGVVKQVMSKSLPQGHNDIRALFLLGQFVLSFFCPPNLHTSGKISPLMALDEKKPSLYNEIFLASLLACYNRHLFTTRSMYHVRVFYWPVGLLLSKGLGSAQLCLLYLWSMNENVKNIMTNKCQISVGSCHTVHKSLNLWFCVSLLATF